MLERDADNDYEAITGGYDILFICLEESNVLPSVYSHYDNEKMGKGKRGANGWMDGWMKTI
jgi:hypothetical protein